MDYLSLGKTGLKVSRLCLGCMSYGSSQRRAWILDEEQSLPFFKQAIEAGINFFDTADMYYGGLSEEVTGRSEEAGIASRRNSYCHQVVLSDGQYSERMRYIQKACSSCD